MYSLASVCFPTGQSFAIPKTTSPCAPCVTVSVPTGNYMRHVLMQLSAEYLIMVLPSSLQSLCHCGVSRPVSFMSMCCSYDPLWASVLRNNFRTMWNVFIKFWQWFDSIHDHLKTDQIVCLQARLFWVMSLNPVQDLLVVGLNQRYLIILVLWAIKQFS